LTLRGLHSIRPAMAAGAIPPPLFFEHRRCPFKNRLLSMGSGAAISQNTRKNISGSITRTVGTLTPARDRHCLRKFENMANTTSAKKATRKIARRTIINKSRRTQMRGSVRTVEEAIKRGDRDAALKAMSHAEPELMKAAQRNIIHKNNASRKVSRLAHQIAKLAK
jgi:small subunit ribosomal protein S20